MDRRSSASNMLRCCLALSIGVIGIPAATAHAAPADPTAAPTMDPVASGSEPVAAILPIAVEGDLAHTDRDSLAGRLVEGLERGAFGVVPPADVASASTEAANCTTAACAKKVASAVGATHVVRTVVEVVDRDYKVTVTLVDGASGKTVATATDNCEICGVADVGEMVGTAAATLKNKLDAMAQGPATLGVSSNPGGSEVRLDGELIGTTPFDGPVIAGKHVLRVSKDGFITIEREVTFVEGVAESLSFELEKVPSPLPSRPYGYAALGLGVAGLATASVFAVLDDRELKVGGDCREDVDDRGNCAQLWDTDYIVLGTAIAGGALVTLGVAIIVSSSARTKTKPSAETARRSRRPRVGVGLGSVSLRGRF